MANKVWDGFTAYWKKFGEVIAWVKKQPGLPVAEGQHELQEMGLNHSAHLYRELADLTPNQVSKLPPIIFGLLQEWIRKGENTSP